MTRRLDIPQLAAATFALVIVLALLWAGIAQAAPAKKGIKFRPATSSKNSSAAGKKAAAGSKFMNLENILISGEGKSITLTLVVPGQPKYEAFLLEDPYRLVLHISNTTTKIKDLTLPNMLPLKGIRLAIYSDKPERIQSVVFDLSALVSYKVTANPRYMQIVLTGVSNANFNAWQAAAGKVDTSETGAGAIAATGPGGKIPPPLPAESLKTAGPTGGLVSTEIQRKFVDYLDGNRRDPFVEIRQNSEVEFGHMPMPRVEELKLVGVSGTAGNFIALMEDGQGFGYAFRVGSPIRDGKVTAINPKEVTFLITEADWSRQVSIPLSPMPK